MYKGTILEEDWRVLLLPVWLTGILVHRLSGLYFSYFKYADFTCKHTDYCMSMNVSWTYDINLLKKNCFSAFTTITLLIFIDRMNLQCATSISHPNCNIFATYSSQTTAKIQGNSTLQKVKTETWQTKTVFCLPATVTTGSSFHLKRNPQNIGCRQWDFYIIFET